MSGVAQLLPGITTVTSHARYYTLHALVFAEAEQRKLDGDATRRLLRRAEVVVGAVSLAHRADPGHAGLRGVHGGDRIAPKMRNGSVDIDELAADRAYVQAGWGFWGPYVGPEYTLELLTTGPQKNTVAGPAANLAALRSGFDGLLDLTVKQTLTIDQLRAASHLCICQGRASADGTLLAELLLPGSATPMYSADRRSQTLRLLLRLTDLLGGVTSPEREIPKALVYGSERDDPVLADFDATPAWTGLILRNELVAAWRNLWAHLVKAIDGFMAIGALGETWADGLPSGSVAQFAESLPGGFDQDGALTDAYAATGTEAMTAEARLLARIMISANRYGRLEDRAQAYFQAERDERYQQLTPEWTQHSLGDWADRPLRDYAVWLTHQLVARAERVALAKATLDRRAGRFKIPTRVFVRDGYIFRDSHEGGGGVALRWGSAFQIMAGLGLVEYRDDQWRVTDQGRAA